MINRFSYYFTQSQKILRRQGLGSLAIQGLQFLKKRKLLAGFLLESVEYHIFSRSRVPHKTVRRKVVADHKPECARWAIYASFDDQSQVRPHVFQQIDALNQNGFGVIFVTSSESLLEADLEVLKAKCHLVILRENLGYDFGSWKVGYLNWRSHLVSSEGVLLINDSCYGPYLELKTIFEKFGSYSLGPLGITKSYEIDEYIQSYFIYFNRDLVRSGVFESFMNRTRLLKTKSAIVRFLEIGGSQYLKRRGLQLNALVDPQQDPFKSEMEKHDQTDPVVNPIGRILVERGLTPFYKRSNGAPLNLRTYSS